MCCVLCGCVAVCCVLCRVCVRRVIFGLVRLSFRDVLKISNTSGAYSDARCVLVRNNCEHAAWTKYIPYKFLKCDLCAADLLKCNGCDIIRGSKLKNSALIVLPADIAIDKSSEGVLGYFENLNTTQPSLVIETTEVRHYNTFYFCYII